ncbi:hypothetical protein [Kineosporia sp. NBRC 101731]|uniref:hypothetical protein n=1 Tax=Kineosporia sp. NBRC 101731 TaxID=3032199 RepID=UPI0024A00F2F|nr:hypothetical protein [Kineosporia sp. NBRC 101731]GLY28795.1 hypothetical protein Kisp02_21600 [Kineosporia sp. NBRC 101731]
MSRKIVTSAALVFASGLVLSAAGVAVASSSHPETVSVATGHGTQTSKVVTVHGSPAQAGDETVEPICVAGDAGVPAGTASEELVAQEDVTPVASTDEPQLLPGEEVLDPSECSDGLRELGEASTTDPDRAND